MFSSTDRLRFPDDASDWPNRAASRIVRAGGLDWHVQVMGEGPDLLLLHGTGASSHSWRDVAPRLMGRYRVIVPDLPGHGFTGMPRAQGLSLRGMAESVAALVAALDAAPVAGVGHSAGAAVLATMVLDGRSRLTGIVAINGAFLPIRNAGLFAPLARLLFLNPLAPRLFALRGASRNAVDRLIRSTGSALDDRGIELYRRLLGRAGHVEGALGMMANWDLDWLRDTLRRLDVPLVLVATDGDTAVPPSSARIVGGLAPHAVRIRLRKGGHLVHEEFPEEVSAVIRDVLDRLVRGEALPDVCQSV
jgi:magnesium chelatase accessory protein